MIDICYYSTQIKEELDGSADYIKRACRYKTNHPDWASLYAKMSEAELGHAENLLKVYDDELKTFKMAEESSDELASYLGAESDLLHDMYLESAATIKHMHEIYAGK